MKTSSQHELKATRWPEAVFDMKEHSYVVTKVRTDFGLLGLRSITFAFAFAGRNERHNFRTLRDEVTSIEGNMIPQSAVNQPPKVQIYPLLAPI